MPQYAQAPALFPDWSHNTESRPRVGLLPSQALRQLIAAGAIASDQPIDDSQIQPASIDLRLGSVAYRVQASFLPGSQSPVGKKIAELQMAELDLSHPTLFEKGCVFIVPLLERLNLPKQLWGKANPKSTTGRLDVFTRLIVDYGDQFERVPEGYSGPLYAEIVPRTFSILVREGLKLNQLRFIRGNPLSADSALTSLDQREPLVYLDDESPIKAQIERGLKLSVSLEARDSGSLIGFNARRNAPAVDLEKVRHYDADLFWEPIRQPKTGRLILNPGAFYILASKEKVRVPPDFAAEMVPFDPSVGEFRIHYAGFFDPGFGYGTNDIKGTPAVLEVRAHEVPFVLENGQIVGRLSYIKMLETPDKIYGASIGSSYARQSVTLSRQFVMPA